MHNLDMISQYLTSVSIYKYEQEEFKCIHSSDLPRIVRLEFKSTKRLSNFALRYHIRTG
jgi:hypothetical protein